MKTDIKNKHVNIYFIVNDVDFEATIKFDYWHLPAKIDGPWEDCYSEEDEFEYELVDVDFASVNHSELRTIAEYERWIEIATAYVRDNPIEIQERVLAVYGLSSW